MFQNILKCDIKVIYSHYQQSNNILNIKNKHHGRYKNNDTRKI